MGLPLFTAPVESDIVQKCPHKNHTTSSPPRTTIRRLAHISAARERASANRRSRTYEHHGLRRTELGARSRTNPSGPGPSAEQRVVARYINAGFQSPLEYERADVVRQDIRNLLLRRMQNRFGSGWQWRCWEQPQQDLDSDWWVVVPLLDVHSARLVRVVEDRLDAPADQDRPGHIDLLPSDSLTVPASNVSLPVIPPPSQPMRFARSYDEPLTWPPVPPEMNGLGDRQRSLSPEGWDTLLTTLTPDPQPPSASSSFVSNSATQSAGQSTNTSMSEQQQQQQQQQQSADSTQEQPCDSGCENSDTEQAEQTELQRLRRTRPRHRRQLPRPSETTSSGAVRFWLPGTDPDAPSTESNTSPFSSAPSLPARTQFFSTMEPRRPSPLWRNLGDDSSGPEPRSTDFRSEGRRGIWIGRLSVGASDDEAPTSRSRRNREGSTGSGNNTGTGDEELTGMQRIVRTLAHRQDIPDEWWAEVGLSRTLAREARDSTRDV